MSMSGEIQQLREQLKDAVTRIATLEQAVAGQAKSSRGKAKGSVSEGDDSTGAHLSAKSDDK